MDHEYFKERIAGWLDKGLSPEEQHLLDEHIRSCPECRELAHRYEKLDALAHRLGDLHGSDDYWERSAQAIEERLGTEGHGRKETDVVDVRSRSGLWWKITGAAAAAVLLAFIGLHQTDILDGDSTQQVKENRSSSPTVAIEEHSEPERLTEDSSPTEAFDEARPSAPTPVSEQKPAATPPDKAGAPTEDGVAERIESDEITNKAITPEEQNAIQRAPISPSIEPAPISPGVSRERKKSQRGQSALAQSDSLRVLSDALAFGQSAPEAADAQIARDSLTVWQGVMDSLAVLSTDELIPHDLGVAYTRGDTKAETGTDKNAQFGPHQELLRAAYNVARLTDDRAEHRRAVEILHRYRGIDHQLLSEQAEGYLRLVEDRFSDEP